MPLPKPEVGLVISYRYLWRQEYEAQHVEGRKDRPCVIVLAVEEQNGQMLVTVAPITHSEPLNKNDGAIIPPQVKAYLKLDHASSWVITREINQFVWPGYDMQKIDGAADGFSYGFLPPRLLGHIKAAIAKHLSEFPKAIVPRD